MLGRKLHHKWQRSAPRRRSGYASRRAFVWRIAVAVVLSLAEEHLPRLQQIAAQHAVPCTVLGRVEGDALTISLRGNTPVLLSWSVETMKEHYDHSLSRTMKGQA